MFQTSIESDKIRFTFEHNGAAVEVSEDGSGKTIIRGEPCCCDNLEFPAHNDDVEELRGSPFQPSARNLGYTINPLFGFASSGRYSRKAQNFANAEHEALHLWACDNVMPCSATGKCLLGHQQGVYETAEIIVTTVQLVANGQDYAELSAIQRFAFENALRRCGFRASQFEDTLNQGVAILRDVRETLFDHYGVANA